MSGKDNAAKVDDSLGQIIQLFAVFYVGQEPFEACYTR